MTRQRLVSSFNSVVARTSLKTGSLQLTNRLPVPSNECDNPIMTGLKHLFRKKRRSHLPTRSTSTCSTTHAPSPEDQAYDPPPYYATNPQPAENGDARPLPRETLSQGLLDPNLNFTAAHMEAQWRAKDKIFAKAVVQFIAERFDGNLKGWAGYKYTYINEVITLGSC